MYKVANRWKDNIEQHGSHPYWNTWHFAG